MPPCVKPVKRAFLLFAAVLLCSCATFNSTVPSWVTAVPETDGTYEYFTASGTDTNAAIAEEKAVTAVLTAVSRYLGTDIVSSATASALGTADDVQRIIESEVTQQSENRLADFKIIEKYTEKNGNQIIVSVLARYGIRAMEQEKTRLAAVMRERADAVLVPEAAGDAALETDRYYEAAFDYVSAANAGLATASTAAKNGTEFPVPALRNLNKAFAAIGRIKLSASTDGTRLMISANTVPVPLSVQYPVKKSNNRQGTQTDTIRPDEDGFTFVLPEQAISGQAYVQVLSAELTQLLTAGSANKKTLQLTNRAIDSINKACAETRVSIAYKKTSQPLHTQVVYLEVSGTCDKEALYNKLQTELAGIGYLTTSDTAAPHLNVRLTVDEPQPDDSAFIVRYVLNYSVVNGTEIEARDSITQSIVVFTVDDWQQKAVNAAVKRLIEGLQNGTSGR